MTLAQFFKAGIAKGVTDYALRATVRPNGEVVDFYIHPDRRDGETGLFETAGLMVQPQVLMPPCDCHTKAPTYPVFRANPHVEGCPYRRE
jgi:hypothetical protein